MTIVDFPLNPSINDLYYIDGKVWKWNGYAWDVLSAGSGISSGFSGYSGFEGPQGISGFSGFSGEGSKLTVSTTPPLDPANGERWLDSASGILYTYIDDGNSAQWVNLSPPIMGISGYSGTVGTSGYSGYSGYTGVSGYSGYSSTSGYSGYSGVVGTSGYSGYSSVVGVEIGTFVSGKPDTNEIIIRFISAAGFSLPIYLAGSYGDSAVAATAQTDFDVKKNGSSVGTIRFATSATTATFIFTAAVTFVPGDILSVVAPAIQDSTLADISITLFAARP